MGNTNKKVLFPDLDEDGEATILRGFAAQIQKLTLPRVRVIQQIGAGIGLVVMTTQDFDKVKEKCATEPNSAISLILASTLSHEDKIAKIAALLKK